MNSPLPVDEELYPPFEGFPPDGIRFLERLKRNNNRPWFHKHKQEYEELVRFPMQCLIADLAGRMADLAPEIEFHPRKSIFRIYRDVRFSKNKAPYKTNIAASFQLRGVRAPTEAPGLYVGIEPGAIYVGGGLYLPTGEQLKAIRAAMVERPDDFLAVVESRRFKREFKEIEGERLQKAPLGYPKDHPMIAYLRYKQFYVGKEFGHARSFRAAFLGEVVRIFSDTMPLVRWLRDALSR
jgi:uncharacterized protein (TIGR02453 family)